MAVSNSYRAYVLEQLGGVTPVRARRMFGGVGIYAGADFFALIDNDTLFFKVDDSNRPDFEKEGMGPFLPFGDPKRPMGYFEVPITVLEDPELLAVWTRKAVTVAKTAKTRRRRR